MPSSTTFIARFGCPIAAVMLIVWAVVTFGFNGPGWVHAFLSIGVFILVWRVVEKPSADNRSAH